MQEQEKIPVIPAEGSEDPSTHPLRGPEPISDAQKRCEKEHAGMGGYCDTDGNYHEPV